MGIVCWSFDTAKLVVKMKTGKMDLDCKAELMEMKHCLRIQSALKNIKL